MKYKIFIFALFGYFCLPVEAILVQDLGGSEWTAINTNKSIKVASRVPGSIYSDLMRTKVIPDIYRDFNDVKLRWVSYGNWTFERAFDVDKSLLEKANVLLVAHGLDTIGQVHLNGHLIGSVENTFVRYRWNVKDYLKAKDNQIRVVFESAPIVAKQFHDKTLKEKYSIYPDCDSNVQNGECYVQMLRKMQSSFSWDWGPAFPTQGIWKPIQLEAFDDLVLRSISVETTKHREHNQWILNYTIHIDGAPGMENSGFVTLYLDGKTLVDSEKFNVNLDGNGETSIERVVLVDSKWNIKTWYPNGLGAQQLYNLTIDIRTTSNESTSKLIKIGFRTVKLVQDRLGSKTEAYSFYFSINDQPIYSKGSNWIPAHVLHEALTERYIRDLLKSAKLANINMLRVWGGGIYEDDQFYEIADEYGILIWQDMMFACALYSTDGQFMDSVRLEIRQQVRRLQYHPSIVLWAGNNENEFGIAADWWGVRDSPHFKDYQEDYRTLYIQTIKPIVEQEDRTRPYLSSSPTNGIKDASEGYLASDPQSELYGDVHFYQTDGNMWDWKVYPSPKFASEYGFQSWSSIQTLEKSISKENFKYPLERALVHREHSGGALEKLNAMLKVHMKLPSSGNETKLEDYIYLTQVFQSMAIKAETEHYRRNRAVSKDGLGNTMGALYWQLNDIWPTVSWASLEFGGKWKMLHYFIRDIFDNLLVNAYEENEELKVVIVRDDHFNQNIKFKLQIDVYDWSNIKQIHQHSVEIETKPFSVTLGYQEKLEQLLETSKCKSNNHCFIEVSLFQSNVQKCTNFLFVGEPKDTIGLQKANIQVKSISQPKIDTTNDGKVFTLELETDHLALFVWLDFMPSSDLNGIFSDNGFMMTNQTKVITFKTYQVIPIEKLRHSLIVKSLKDVN